MNKFTASKAGAEECSQQKKKISLDTPFLPYSRLSIHGAE